jgi:hypothetical protein
MAPSMHFQMTLAAACVEISRKSMEARSFRLLGGQRLEITNERAVGVVGAAQEPRTGHENNTTGNRD